MMPMVSKIHILGLLSLTLCADFSVCAPQVLESFSSDTTYTANGETRTGKVYSDGRSVRIESEVKVPGQKNITFLRLESGLAQSSVPLMRAYTEYPYGALSDAQFVRYLRGAEVKTEPLGTELFDGQHCEKVAITASYNGQAYSSVEWRSRELHGFVVKSQDVQGQWSAEYRNIRFGTPEGSVFELPPGYVRIAYSRDWTAVFKQMQFAENLSDQIAIAKKAGLRVFEYGRISLPEDNPLVAAFQVCDPVTGSALVDPATNGDPVSPSLPAPSVRSPENGGVFYRPSRKMELQWSPVPGAASYYVQVVVLPRDATEAAYWSIDRGLTYIQQTTRQTAFAFEIGELRRGRWRVQALDAHGTVGHPTAWFTFGMTQ
jgi:hypothetical protein